MTSTRLRGALLVLTLTTAACGSNDKPAAPTDSAIEDVAVDTRVPVDATLDSADAEDDVGADTSEVSDSTPDAAGDSADSTLDVADTDATPDADVAPDATPETTASDTADAAEACVPTTEACNNLDDDCDGVIDNGVTESCYSGPPATAGVGACRAGTRTCSAGAFGSCTGEVLPVTEDCNNIDDDCDGMTDEELTRACYTGDPSTLGVGRCRGGTQVCSAGVFGTTCVGEQLPIVETCNGEDDNCNGVTDEGCPDGGT